MEPFQKGDPEVASESSNGDKTHHLSFSRPGCEGNGTLTAEGLIVEAGSYGRRIESASCPTWIVNLRRKLVESGAADFRNERLVLVKDHHLFSSPSAAAAALVGRTINGRTSWKNATGKTLDQLEKMRLDSVQADASEELM